MAIDPNIKTPPPRKPNVPYNFTIDQVSAVAKIFADGWQPTVNNIQEYVLKASQTPGIYQLTAQEAHIIERMSANPDWQSLSDRGNLVRLIQTSRNMKVAESNNFEGFRKTGIYEVVNTTYQF